MHDVVNHPNHYTKGKVECIEALAAATEGLEGIEAVCTANAIKYMWRWKWKNGVEDIDKAIWYLNHLKNSITASQKEPITIDLCDEELTIDDCVQMLIDIEDETGCTSNMVFVCDAGTHAALLREAIFAGRAITNERRGKKHVTRIHHGYSGFIDIVIEADIPYGSAFVCEWTDTEIKTRGVFEGIEF